MVANTPPLIGWLIVFAALLSLSAQWVTAQTENSPPPPPTDGYPFDSKVRVSPTMAIILICLISTFFVMGCLSVYVRQCVERRMAARSSFTLEADGVGSSRRTGRRRAAAFGLNAAAIEAFPTFMYSEVKGLKIGQGALECAVCLNEFEDEETLRLLPKCSHVFHPDCIDAWLSSHITCPVCRANLIPKPGEIASFTVPSHEPETEAGDSGYSPVIHNREPQNLNSDRVVEDVIVDSEFREGINGVQTPNRFHPPRSMPGKERFTGNFRKSFSTGHSLVQPGEDCERFTLRLPEDVRNQLVSANLSRTKSCVAFPSARSSRKGYRCGSGGTGKGKNFNYERFDREGRFMMTPPFFSRAGSARSPKTGAGGGGGGEESTAGPKMLSMSVRPPLRRLFAMDNRRDDVNVGERSFDRLRLDCDQV